MRPYQFNRLERLGRTIKHETGVKLNAAPPALFVERALHSLQDDQFCTDGDQVVVDQT